jgi:hexulose-6-phosphate isomerase
MKISASYWMFDGGLDGRKPIYEAIRETKLLGFDAIELCIAGTGVLTEKTSEKECRKIVQMAADEGITISGVASGEAWSYPPSSNDINIRKRIIDFTKRALEVTKWLGTDSYLYIPGAVDIFFLPDAEKVPYDICYQRAIDGIYELLPAAEAAGVALCIENVWNKFLLSPLEMRDFIDMFNSPFVASYFDVGNVMLTGYPEHWINILGKRIRRVHIKDFITGFGNADGFVDLSDGNVDFKIVRKALEGIGYDSYLTSEIIPYAEGRPAKTAKEMIRLFK